MVPVLDSVSLHCQTTRQILSKMRKLTSLFLLSLSSASPAAVKRDAPKWTVTEFDFHAIYVFTTPAHQNSWGYVSFNLTNNLIPYTFSCATASNQQSDFFYGTVQYACSPTDDAPYGAAASFKFNRPTGQLDVEEIHRVAYVFSDGSVLMPYGWCLTTEQKRRVNHNNRGNQPHAHLY